MARFSIQGKAIFIVALFVLIAIALQGMVYLQSSIFDGVRAYVRGEALWAKAQKDAVLYLNQYSYSHDDADYLAFRDAIEVNAGDSRARLALLADPPDGEEAEKGFVQGGNDPEDVDSMIWFFLKFQSISYMHQAIEIWTRGDAKIAKLQSIADGMRSEIQGGTPRAERLSALRARLGTLNNELFALENQFSSILSEGARWVRTTTTLVSVALLALFLAIGIYISRQIILGIAKTERELVVSQSRFRSLRDSNTIGIVSWWMDGRVDEANDFILEMLGLSRSDIEGGLVNWRDITPTEHWPRTQQAIEELIAYGRCEPFEKAFIHKDGHQVPVYLGASMLEGEPQHGIAYIVDLSERKLLEERFRRVVESAPYAMLKVDADGRIDMVNTQAERMLGYAREELLEQEVDILLPKPFREAHPQQRGKFFGELQSRPMGLGRELFARRKDGSEFPVVITLNPLEAEDGIRVLATIVDISDRRQKEERIQAALEEKDLLLHEIHHRVKNNLHVVHNLLDLQAMRIKDAEVQEMLMDCQNRIRSMALIHQTLYESKNFARVDFGCFLGALVPTLISSYGLGSDNVHLNIEVSKVSLPINSAVPCGLLVNELVTNALKHGFPDGRGGEISVKLARLDDERMRLVVSDDGVGIPENLDIEQTGTLGLSLVTLLSQQLGGKLTIQRNQPTRFALDFPLPDS
jgi:PAS domain S-box-containing protein